MKDIVKCSSLIPFLNEKNHSDVKYQDDGIVLRKEAIVSSVESVTEDGTAVCIITTQGTDRTGDVVISAGINTTEFQKIPAIFLNHDYSLLPVAKCLELIHEKNCIKAKIQFALNVPAVKNIFELVKAGVLKGVSIGFAANEVVMKGTKAFDDICKGLGIDKDTYERTYRIIKNWTMYEFSICSIPANSECYVKSLQNLGQEVSPELIKYLGVKDLPKVEGVKEVAEDTEEDEEDDKEEIEEEKGISEEMAKGIEVEKEHDALYELVSKEKITVEEFRAAIAKVHIDEDEEYYSKLEEMEGEEEDSEGVKNANIKDSDSSGASDTNDNGVKNEDIKPIEVIPHVKRYIQVIQTPEEVVAPVVKAEVAEVAEVKKVEKPVEAPIEVIPHVKRYIQVIQTPEEVEAYIKACVEARLRGRASIR